MPAFHPLADTLASALRTLVLLGVLAALVALPAAAISRLRAAGAPRLLAAVAGPAITVHALNLAFFVVLAVWIGVDAARGTQPLPGAGQLALFAASFLVPNLAGVLAWRSVLRRRPDDEPPHVAPTRDGA